MKKIQLTAALILCGLTCFAQHAQDLFPIKQNGKWGYINKTGEVIISPVYTYAHADLYKTVNIVKDTEGYFLADNAGKPIFKERYASFSDNYESGLLGFQDENGNWGCVDTTGKTIIPFELKNEIHFMDGITIAFRNNNTAGYYNIQGEFTPVAGYTALRNLGEGFLMAGGKNSNGKDVFGIYDTHKRKITIAPAYSRIEGVKNGHAVVTDSLVQTGVLDVHTGAYSILPLKGQIIYSSSYGPYSAKALATANDLYAVQYDGKTMITDYSGKVLFKPGKQYQDCAVLGFYNGYATFIHKGQSGVMDVSGKVVIAPAYEKISLPSAGGILAVCHTGLCGYADVSGKKITSLAYTDALMFKNGLGAVYTGGFAQDIYPDDTNCKLGYVDAAGKVIWEPSN